MSEHDFLRVEEYRNKVSTLLMTESTQCSLEMLLGGA